MSLWPFGLKALRFPNLLAELLVLACGSEGSLPEDRSQFLGAWAGVPHPFAGWVPTAGVSSVSDAGIGGSRHCSDGFDYVRCGGFTSRAQVRLDVADGRELPLRRRRAGGALHQA